MLSSAGQDKKAHVAFAGTSSNVHPPIDTGTGGIGGAPAVFPAYRGTAGSGGIGEMGLRSSSGSHSPIHPRRDGGGGGGGGGYPGLVPAEAESGPPGVVELDPTPPLSVAGGGVGGEGDGVRKKRGKKRSSKSRRDGGRSSSSRRAGGGDGGMRPAVPDAGPEMDEMRPSPGDGTGAPGPWMS